MFIYTYDSNGFYVSAREVDDPSYVLATDETSTPLGSADFHKPKFDSSRNIWVEGLTDVELLQVAKDQKNAELDAKYHETLANGFTSSALGTAHTYPADGEAQANFLTVGTRFLTDPNYTTAYFKTLDSGFLAHTKDQFYQVFANGHDFGVQQDTYLNQKKSDVAAAATIPDVGAIEW